jgi:Aspartyl protease
MWRTPFCAFLVGVGYFFVPLALAQTAPTRIPMVEVAGKEIVQVSINGTGPYDFVLDTGSNVTLVKRQLLPKLKISTGEPLTIVTVLGGKSQQRGLSAESVSLAGFSVQHLALIAFDGVQMGPLEGRVQGILGENFLEHFDLLIDNDRHTLTLDPTSGLAATLVGERLQVSRFGNFNLAVTPDRLVVGLKMPSYLQKPLFFLVDSGTNTAVLYPGQGGYAIRAMQSQQRGDLTGLDGRQSCQIQKATLKLGTGTFSGIELATCEGLTRNKMDTDGVLPTRVFHQFFISHKGGYVIVDPQLLDNAGAIRGQISESYRNDPAAADKVSGKRTNPQ